VTKLETLTFSIAGDGRANVAERHFQEPHGYRSEEFFQAAIDDVELRFGIDEDTPEHMCGLQLSRYHMADENSGRVFHALLEVYLDKADLRRLAAFAELISREIDTLSRVIDTE
jgi:hypothetical protein